MASERTGPDGIGPGGNGSHGPVRGRIDARALRFAIGFPIVLAAGFVLAAFSLNGQVPRGAVLPLGGSALPFPWYLAVSAGAIVGMGELIGIPAARTVLPAVGRRLLLGSAVGVSLFLAALFGSALVAQAGTSQAPSPRVDAIVLAMGCGAALALGVIMALVYKPDEQWTRRDDEALLRVLDPSLVQEQLSYWIHPRSSVIVMILLTGAFPGILIGLLLPWLGLLLFLLALALIGFLTARVTAGSGGVRVRMAGTISVIRFPVSAVENATADGVLAREFGGWGLRRHDATVSYLSASGPAVVVRLKGKATAILGAPDAARARDLAARLSQPSNSDDDDGGGGGGDGGGGGGMPRDL
ncbi:hypothetical protein IV498_12400 [Paenarthrobacter sp. Z7-10]|uniref:hypothetical protein n=1 Tax=Paenarthrobacter sp. Z7-10 TaxID=2787635 RepID=UPI0022A8FAEE|nr:hypothetical protein [Paenarthrobacter sp. Z7-10]MCZ2403957.1 hypothetical protein [Paenarthrobacter sp. Z7-10]